MDMLSVLVYTCIVTYESNIKLHLLSSKRNYLIVFECLSNRITHSLNLAVTVEQSAESYTFFTLRYFS